METVDVIDNITKSFHEGNNSHAFLLVTNNIQKCKNDVIKMVKEINCLNGGHDNCNICSTIEKNNNPDLIMVFPDGKEIRVESINSILERFSTKPLICKYSTYIIEEADKLNISSANKILKFLEEPDGNIIGFYITERLQGILPTIKSRCEIYNLRYGNESILDVLEISEEEYADCFDVTYDLLNKLNDYPKYMLMLEAKKISEFERDKIDIILSLLKKMYTIKYEKIINNKYCDVEFVKNILEGITTEDLKIIVKRIRILDNVISDFQFNLNKELLLNRLMLLWE